MADFDQEIAKQLRGILIAITEELEEEVRSFGEGMYRELVSISPVVTGYYKSNHRIILRDGKGRFKTAGTAKRSPLKKDTAEPGALDTSAETTAEELAKLKKLKLGDIITITTTVPYAFDSVEGESVEVRHGVYAQIQAMINS